MFQTFFERDAARESRRRSRRRTILLSVLLHGLALAAVVGYSLWHVEDLWSPSVEVKVFSPSAVPRAVVTRPSSSPSGNASKSGPAR